MQAVVSFISSDEFSKKSFSALPRRRKSVPMLSGRRMKNPERNTRLRGIWAANPDNLPMSEWITQVFVITVFSATERILPLVVREERTV